MSICKVQWLRLWGNTYLYFRFCIAELEFLLGECNAIDSKIKKDPASNKKKVKDALMSQLGVRNPDEDSESE